MNKASKHIFLSYAAEDRSRVASLASLLEAEGWTVWWDRESLPPGQSFRRVIDEAIQSAFTVVVCWSKASIDSDWVIDEANEAKQQNKLLPVLLETVKQPYGFRGYHYIDLSTWNDQHDHTAYRRLVKALIDKQPPDKENKGKRHSTKPPEIGKEVLNQKVVTANVPALIERLNNPSTEPKERLAIGNQLAKLNDPRPGVGLDEQGLPDIEWVEIPGGSFLYGEENESRELPTFFIGRYPVTNAQYQAFIADGGYSEKRWWEGLGEHSNEPEEPTFSESNRPRETVSWYEAIAFCRWLSDKLGYSVQLPTEMQWGRTARGTDGRSYPWGEEYRSGYANVDETRNKSGPYNLQQTTAVGIYPQGASPDDVLDLSGNVGEWCLNAYDNPENTDPGRDDSRVLRGSSWFGSLGSARSSGRLRFNPVVRRSLVGFRVLCSSPISR